jgi:hypothetical protein
VRRQEIFRLLFQMFKLLSAGVIGSCGPGDGGGVADVL